MDSNEIFIKTSTTNTHAVASSAQWYKKIRLLNDYYAGEYFVLICNFMKPLRAKWISIFDYVLLDRIIGITLSGQVSKVYLKYTQNSILDLIGDCLDT